MGTLLIRPPGHRRDVALRPAASAMVWLAPGQPHETIAVPGVALGDDEVLVAIEMSTICESDVRTVSGCRPAPAPLVLGHESVGRVIAIGDAGANAVDGSPVRIGDRVVWSAAIPCGGCDPCRRGQSRSCRSPGRYGHEKIGARGELTGAFGSHVQLRAGTSIVRVPETLPASVLAPASCATAIAWAAIARARRERELTGAAVRVHGAGLAGLSAAAIAAELGADVEVQDADAARRQLSARFGAAPLDREPDVVIDTTGDRVEAAIADVAAGGVVVLAGDLRAGCVPGEPAPFDAESIVRRAITIAGVPDCTTGELAETVSFLAGRGRAYPFADAVGAVRPLSEIDEALAEAGRPDAPLRVGLVPGR